MLVTNRKEARKRVARELALDYLERHAGLVAVDRPDARYLVSTSDRTIGQQESLVGQYQLSLRAACISLPCMSAIWPGKASHDKGNRLIWPGYGVPPVVNP